MQKTVDCAPSSVAPGGLTRRPLLRKLALAAITVSGAVLVSVGATFFLHRPAPLPPASPLFHASSSIRELQGLSRDFPTDAEVQLRLGEAYLGQGHYLSALDALETSLKLGAPEAPARSSMAAACSRLERYDDAIRHLVRLIELEPKQLELRLQLAAHQVSLGRKTAARKLLDQIPRDGEGYPQFAHRDGRFGAMEQLAGAYGELGVLDRSSVLAQRVVRDAPERLAAHLILGRALLEQKRAVEAIPHLERAEKAAPTNSELLLLLIRAWKTAGALRHEHRVLAALETVAGSGTAPGQVFVDMGAIYERKKQWVRAGDAFRRAYESKVHPEIALKRAYENYAKAARKEDAIYLEGLLYESRGDYARAMSQYRKLTRIHDCCHSGYMHIARVQAKRNRPREALATLQRARKIGEPPSKLFVDLARTYRLLHQPDNEQAMWKEFIRRDKETADLGHQNLGVLADLAGKVDEAEAHYRKCVELQPEADLYWSKLGKLLIERRSNPERLHSGIAALERSLQLAPQQSDTLVALAAAYRYAGRSEEALWAARHSIDVDPGNGRGYQHIGELLVASGRKEEGKQALEFFRKYRQYYQTWETLMARVRRNRDDLVAQRHLARFYERSGSLMNAADAYVQILENRPDDADARRRLLTLREQIRESVSL